MLSFVANGATASFAGVTSGVVFTPAGLQISDLLVVVFGIENVGAGSGPYVSHTTEAGWQRATFQAPSGSGSGLEVWWANWGFGAQTTFHFFAATTAVARESAYRCASGVGGEIVLTATAQHTGDNPVCPSITTTEADTLVLPCAASELAGLPGFAYPAPYTERWDNARGGVFGNVEACLGEANQAAPGASGTITLTAVTATGSDRGCTATLGAICRKRKSMLPFLHAGP